MRTASTARRQAPAAEFRRAEGATPQKPRREERARGGSPQPRDDFRATASAGHSLLGSRPGSPATTSVRQTSQQAPPPCTNSAPPKQPSPWERVVGFVRDVLDHASGLSGKTEGHIRGRDGNDGGGSAA